jgi:hypothetical protein
VKERRNETRVAIAHLRTGLDLIHVSLEQLPDPKGDGCNTFKSCSVCDPICAGTHALKAAEYWMAEGMLRLENVEKVHLAEHLGIEAAKERMLKIHGASMRRET